MLIDLSLPESIAPTITCLVVLLPLVFLGLRFNYRFALEQATRRSEADELTKQYYLLLVCLVIGVATMVAGTGVLGLFASVILLLIAASVYRHRVTVLAVHLRGKPACVGRATVWSIPLYAGLALLLGALAISELLAPWMA
jgi:hypothetical protein